MKKTRSRKSRDTVPLIWILKKLPVHSHNDEKENQIFLIYKEIKSGAVAKYMTNGLLIYGKIFASFLMY